MASNIFGTVFKYTTWGESHGKMIGVVIDGCPAGMELSIEEIQRELDQRSPGNNLYTSPRKETDQAEIVSGLMNGRTTGAPLSILIQNKDADSSHYAPLQGILRPGHANYTYLQKYGLYDYKGGGRASARETAGRVAAGAVAKKLLAHFNIQVIAYLQQIGDLQATLPKNFSLLHPPLFCPDPIISKKMEELLLQIKKEGDSIGGVVGFVIEGVPPGLGDPIYEKLEAKLASAMMSLPASKGFEIGEGFQASSMRGSCHNDLFSMAENKITTETNHSGGILGGISNGMPITGRVAFKPTSSIQKTQKSVSVEGLPKDLKLPEGSRHDPCVAVRAVPVVGAMAALVIADALLLNRMAKL